MTTTYKVPTQVKEKTDYAMIILCVLCLVLVCIAFKKAVDGPGPKTVQVKEVSTKYAKGKSP